MSQQTSRAPAADTGDATPAQREAHLRRSAWWWLRAAAITVTLFAGWQLLLIVQGWVTGLLSILLFFVFGAVVAFAAAPVMRALERWARFPHLLAVLTSLLGVLVVVAPLVYLVAGPLATEITALVRQAPGLVRSAQQHVADVERTLNAHGITVGNQNGGGLAGSLLGGSSDGFASHLGSFVISGATGVIVALVDTVIVLVTAFWLLDDGPALRSGFLGMLPGRARNEAEFALDAARVVLGGYVRGQLLLAFVVGTLAWAGCEGLGVPYPIVAGVAAGVFELVPLLGPFLGGAVAVTLALTRDPVLALDGGGLHRHPRHRGLRPRPARPGALHPAPSAGGLPGAGRRHRGGRSARCPLRGACGQPGRGLPAHDHRRLAGQPSRDLRGGGARRLPGAAPPPAAPRVPPLQAASARDPGPPRAAGLDAAGPLTVASERLGRFPALGRPCKTS